MFERLKQLLGGSPSKNTSKKGTSVTREMIVGDVTEDLIWFEVPTRSSGQTGMQYAVPRRHVEYSQQLTERLNSLDPGTELYEVTFIATNDKGTAWRCGNLTPLNKTQYER